MRAFTTGNEGGVQIRKPELVAFASETITFMIIGDDCAAPLTAPQQSRRLERTMTTSSELCLTMRLLRCLTSSPRINDTEI